MSSIRHHIHKQLAAFNKAPGKIDYEELSRRFGVQDGLQSARLLRHVFANLAYINFIITKLAERPVKKIDAPVLAALQLGVADILFMETKQHAAVFENVELLAKRQAYLRGFANGVLRNLLRQVEAKTLPTPTDVATLYSEPEWFVDMMQTAYGKARTEQFFAACNTPQPTVLRVNRLKSSRAAVMGTFASLDIPCRASSISEDGIIVDAMPSLQTTGLAKLWNSGALYFQNDAAQLASLLLAARPGEKIVDICSAPGGKATHLAEITNDQAKIIAVDHNPSKLKMLQDNLHRLQLKAVQIQQSDATDERLIPLLQEADAVLLDPPCSGLGVLRKSPEGRWRQSIADVERLAQQQQQMLGFVLRHMRPGARGVYSVCTVTPQETSAVIDDAMSRLPEFQLHPIASDWQGGIIASHIHRGCFVSLTGDGTLDGYFIACFSKK